MRDVFTKLGRHVEQFKQEMDAAEAENADYECMACGTRLAVDHETCPECGAEEIVPTKSEAESS